MMFRPKSDCLTSQKSFKCVSFHPSEEEGRISAIVSPQPTNQPTNQPTPSFESQIISFDFICAALFFCCAAEIPIPSFQVQH